MLGLTPPSGEPLPDRVDGWTDGYGYLRISDDPEGEEAGVLRQEEDVRAKAKAERINLVGIFWDNDTGASTLSKKPRPEYDAMLTLLQEGKGKAIVGYTNGRLTRRPAEWIDLISLANSQGVIIRTAKSGQYDLTTADGRAVALTIAVWDAAEVERLSERLRRQQLQHAQDGKKHQGRHRVFGYNRDFTINEAEAAYVRDAFTRKAKGESLTNIAYRLNEAGIKTTGGGNWDASKVSGLIKRRDYIAEITIKGEVIGAAAFDPIITDRVIWEKANAEAEKVNNRGRNTRRSLLSGFMICDVCGTKMKQGGEKNAQRYNCPSPKGTVGACGSNSIVGPASDLAIFNAAWAKEQDQGKEKPAVPVRDFKAEADAITAEIAKVNEYRRARKVAIEDAMSMLADLRADLAQVHRDEAASAPVDYGILQTMVDWDEWTLAEQRVWLEKWISYVIVTKAVTKGVKGFKPERLTVHFKDGTSRTLSRRGKVVDWSGQPVPEKPTCSEGDGLPIEAKGLCNKHYKAQWRKARKASQKP